MSGSKMYEQGKVYEVSEAKGERLISFKYAEEVIEPKKTSPKNATTKKISNNGSTINRTNNTKRSKGTPKKRGVNGGR